MSYIVLAICFTSLIGCCYSDALPRPSYINACHRDDPHINDCALINARNAIPWVAKGDPVAHIPNMYPLHVNQINVQPSHNMQLNFTNLDIHGLPTAEPILARIDLEQKSMVVGILLPKLILISNYTIKGNLQILPIEGSGPANISFDNVTLVYHFKWDLKKRKNIEYMYVNDDHFMEFRSDRAYYRLENLFNGNRQLGTAMEKFMEENWEAVHRDLSPLIAKAIDTIVTSIVYNILKKIPADQIFLT